MRKAKSDHLVPIQSLFERYRKNLIAPQKSVETEAVLVIREVLNLPPNIPLQVSYQPSTKTLHIKTSLIRQEVLRKQTAVLTALRSKLGDKSAPQTII